MTKHIYLPNVNLTLVDDDDYDFLMQWKWYFNSGYAKRCSSVIELDMGLPHTISMHRQILPCPKGLVIDHINRNKLDNRKCNLRICTYSQNFANSPPRTGKYKGVSFSKGAKRKWISEITVDYRRIRIGCFDSEIEAAAAYNEQAKKYFSKFAYLNEI